MSQNIVKRLVLKLNQVGLSNESAGQLSSVLTNFNVKYRATPEENQQKEQLK